MATSFALRIHVPAEPQLLSLHFRGTPLRLDTVTSSSGATRAVGPCRSTATIWTGGSGARPSSTRGNDGTSTPTHRDQPAPDGTASAPCRMALTLIPSSLSSETAESRFLARESYRRWRRKLRQQTRQELLAEMSRLPEAARLTDAGHTPPRAVLVEPTTARAGAGPIALDPAIGSFRGRLDTAGSREENVAPGAHAGPANAPQARETPPPAPSTPRTPPHPESTPMAEDRRPSPASVERTAAASPVASETAALPVRCQCGMASFSTPNVAPVALYHCHCTECQKQSASAFGTSALYPAAAFFPLAAGLALNLKCWTRPTDAGGRMHCYFCPSCGSRLFHRIVDPDGTPRATVSIKAGCIEGLDWRGGKHIYTRSAVVAIPAGAEQYDTLPGGA